VCRSESVLTDFRLSLVFGRAQRLPGEERDRYAHPRLAQASADQKIAHSKRAAEIETTNYFRNRWPFTLTLQDRLANIGSLGKARSYRSAEAGKQQPCQIPTLSNHTL
jgi:hypothetical protein